MLDVTHAAGLTNLRIAAVRDLGISGDGVVDFVALFVEQYWLYPYADFFVVSGADGSLLLQKHFGRAGLEVGQFVRNVGDADGDGWEDLIAGTAWFEGPCVYEMGRVAFVSGGGTSFNPVYFNENGQNVSYFLGAPLGDVNGDGTTEFVVGGSCGNGQSVYTAAPGAPIQPIRFFPQPAVAEAAIATLGDFDGDEVDDYARVMAGQDVAFVSGLASATQLQLFPGAGSRITVPGDVDRDGVKDLLATAPFTGSGQTRLFSGKDARLLWTAPETATSVVEVGDVNGDGLPDLGLDLGSRMQIWSPVGLGTDRGDRLPPDCSD